MLAVLFNGIAASDADRILIFRFVGNPLAFHSSLPV
jgi:hypothetical protein